MRKASSSMSSDATAEQTSRRSSRSGREELPPALSSMWRLCKLGYTHEPRLVVVVVTLTLLQAVPDALIALWLSLMADALLAGNTAMLFATLAAIGSLGDFDLAPPGSHHATDPTVPRPRHDRARDPCRHTPGVGLGA